MSQKTNRELIVLGLCVIAAAFVCTPDSRYKADLLVLFRYVSLGCMPLTRPRGRNCMQYRTFATTGL